jgi:hypothetical protein
MTSGANLTLFLLVVGVTTEAPLASFVAVVLFFAICLKEFGNSTDFLFSE